MAASSIRLRRGLSAVSALHRSFSSATSAPPISLPFYRTLPSSSAATPSRSRSSLSWSSISLLSTRSFSAISNNIPDEIGPDTILFEGCDYNHWLFVMDFPKDNKPSPEEMVRTYEETCAKGLNISLEEAKKKIYACSTTTYTGFQAVMTEEESKKFEGLPGVIFVLPDSYIDPVNKQYGGDQYINGTIIPRPPPIQYGRNAGRRPRQDNQMPSLQGNPSYNNRGPMQADGRNHGPSQNCPPEQNYGQPSQNYPPQQSYGQASQNYPPRQSYGQASQNSFPQQNYGQTRPNPPPQQSYGQAPLNPPPQQNYGQAPPNPPPQQKYGQAPPNPPAQQNYGQAPPNYPPQQNFGQGTPNYPPQQNYGQAPQNYPPQQNYGQAPQNYPPQQNYGQAPQNYPHQQQRPQYAQQQSFGPPGQGDRRGYVPSQNFGPPGQGERRDPQPRHGGAGAPGWSDDTFTPSYMKDFKPSFMEDFEKAEQGSKEQTGSQQRYPPPGQGNFA